MRIVGLMLGVLLLSGGCRQWTESARSQDVATFGPSTMLIHRVWTQIKDSNGDGQPDGIDAVIEFRDQFGDPTKAAGTVMFELFEYRQADPDPRGQRLGDPWIGSIVSLAEQQAAWSTITRSYRFQLRTDQIKPDRSYVLAAMYQPQAGDRLFAQILLQPLPKETKPVAPASTEAVTQPTTRTPQP